jgi:tRNA pseudouridine38-40 synthase
MEIAYRGDGYHGWQVQDKDISVQSEIQDKLSLLLQHPTEITGSGRTDTGVHCQQQFAHFDTEYPIDPDQITYKLNAFLNRQVVVKQIFPVAPNAHARFDALSRYYQYRILFHKDPFRKDFVHTLFKTVDREAMQQAAACLPGEHDFTPFCKVSEDLHHHRCRVFEAFWQEKDDEWVFHIRANRFLRGMVRLIVGALLEVGTGKLSPADFRNILEGKKTNVRRTAAPPHALYLVEVAYPATIYAAV